MSATRRKRLPGIQFETQAPPLTEVLPRMDIAVFVGFAASGPLQVPVAVESEAQFTAIFGDDAPLAWDFTNGEQLYAHLGPAVRAFFRNNGRRCWVIRVARQVMSEAGDPNYARYNHFPIPGLARAAVNEDGQITIAPAFARARCEGSWSDRVQVSAAALATPIRSTGPMELVEPEYVLRVARPAGDKLAPGALLRLQFADGSFAFLPVTSAESTSFSPPLSPPAGTSLLELRGTNALWFAEINEADVASLPIDVSVGLFTTESAMSPGDDSLTDALFGNPRSGRLSSKEQPFDGTLQLELNDCATADAPLPGSLVRIEFAGRQWWMTVEALTSAAEANVPMVLGHAFRSIGQPDPLPVDPPSCELLSLELWVRQEDEYSVSLGDLGFHQAHERFWARLPTDQEIYREPEATDTDPPATVLWRQVGDLFRFPLAGPVKTDGVTDIYLPLFVSILPDNYLEPIELNA